MLQGTAFQRWPGESHPARGPGQAAWPQRSASPCAHRPGLRPEQPPRSGTSEKPNPAPLLRRFRGGAADAVPWVIVRTAGLCWGGWRLNGMTARGPHRLRASPALRLRESRAELKGTSCRHHAFYPRCERETDRFCGGGSCGQNLPSRQPRGEGRISAQTKSKDSRTQDTQVCRRALHGHGSRLFVTKRLYITAHGSDLLGAWSVPGTVCSAPLCTVAGNPTAESSRQGRGCPRRDPDARGHRGG